jgi:hypothetical protein
MFKKFNKNLGIFKYVSITYYFEMMSNYYHEMDNYLYFKRKIKDADDEGLVSRNNMKVSKSHNEMYFVVNLQPENLLLDKNDMMKIEQLVVGNEIVKIETSFEKYSLFDMFKFTYERILNESYYAYGVTCKFNFRYINKKNNKFLLFFTTGLILIGCFIIWYF